MPFFFFFQAEDGIRDLTVTGVQTCALPISSDGTGKTAERGGTGRETTVLILPRHRGKGAALATGIAAALQDGAWVIVTLDADGQHPPEEIPRVAVPVLEGAADLVLGARARTVAMPVGRRCTNWLRSEEHTSELQSQSNLVCRLLLEKKKTKHTRTPV